MLLRERSNYKGKMIKKEDGNYEYVITEETFKLTNSTEANKALEDLDAEEIEKEPLAHG